MQTYLDFWADGNESDTVPQFFNEIAGNDLRIPSDALKLDALANYDDGLRKLSHSVHVSQLGF
jgi:hypothetical protein